LLARSSMGYLPQTGDIMKWTIFWSAVLTATLASSAKADWQYTRWGMTPAEVSKASGGKAVNNSNAARQSTEDEIAKLVAPYSTGEYAFTAAFLFNRSTDRLGSVRLKLENPSKCNALRHELLGKYSKPFNDQWSGALKIATWHDRPNNLRIDIVDLGGTMCELIYRPLASANSKGL
jgi:hypothetical protein